MEQINLLAKELFCQIRDKIRDKQIIFFGEIHGTREIPMILTEFFKIFSQEEDFDLAVEIPKNHQEKITNFLRLRQEEILNEISFFQPQKNSDGRNSLEYLHLIKALAEINRQKQVPINVLCIDLSFEDKFESQNEREEGMASNILDVWKKEKKMFVILGNIHASKKEFAFCEKIIYPVAYRLSTVPPLTPNIFSVNLQPRTGEFFNFGIKKVKEIPSDRDLLFDETFLLDEVSPCSFLENKLQPP